MVQGKPEGRHGCLVAERLSDYIVKSRILQKIKAYQGHSFSKEANSLLLREICS